MTEIKHTIDDLKQMQSLPLKSKIAMTKRRISEWLDKYDAYVSFSGGKDSTVLLDLARQIDPTIPAVYVNTGLEYPEITQFVKTKENVTWLKPKMTFREVVEKYGFPFISKEVSECVYGAKKYLTKLIEKEQAKNSAERVQTSQSLTGIDTKSYTELGNSIAQNLGQRESKLPYQFEFEKLSGCGRYGKPNEGSTTSIENLLDLENIPQIVKQTNNIDKAIKNYRVQRMLGILTKQGMVTMETIPSVPKDRSQYSCKKYAFLLDAPFDISSQCCNVMKKNPVHKYSKETGRMPITGQMASESQLRTQQWLRNGCNGFNMKSPISNPMSFWTEQDVLAYIAIFDIPICSVYGQIVIDDGTPEGTPIDSTEGWLEAGMFDRQLLKTTGCNRTGCIACGYGCHLEKEDDARFVRLKETHPKFHEMIFRPWEIEKEVMNPETGEMMKVKVPGLNYKEVIDWINEHGNLHIKY